MFLRLFHKIIHLSPFYTRKFAYWRVSDDYIVRIADFGLSKDLYVKDYYRRDKDSKTPLPLKWMAIESLRNNGEFTTQSDVVSYNSFNDLIKLIGVTILAEGKLNG